MNKDLIEFYEEEKNKIQREISDLWEVGKKKNRKLGRVVRRRLKRKDNKEILEEM